MTSELLQPPAPAARDIADAVTADGVTVGAGAMFRLLQESIAVPSVSGSEAAFSAFIADWGRSEGFDVDVFETSESQVADYPSGKARHLPLAGRPTVVIRFPGTGGGRSLLFNAHGDVVDAPSPDQWRFSPWSGAVSDGKIFGRGACDDKGPLISALWAMTALKRSHPRGLAGDVLLELVPGEEDCVGLGTLTSVIRGYRADAAIVLEPTDNVPCRASRGGCRFELSCHGRAVHGTVKWLGNDAIATLRTVMDALSVLEQRWNNREADPAFAAFPIARPVTIDNVHAGRWQGMVCDRASCAGYLELLPGDDLVAWQDRFKRELLDEVAARGKSRGDVDVAFTEIYAGHALRADHEMCRTALMAAKLSDDAAFAEDVGAGAFNSGCEAGLRANMHGTPTLVWGPGSLAQAHAVDEFIEMAEVQSAALMFARFALLWAGDNTDAGREKGVGF
jgi:acetylornithine deacetylase